MNSSAVHLARSVATLAINAAATKRVSAETGGRVLQILGAILSAVETATDVMADLQELEKQVRDMAGSTTAPTELDWDHWEERKASALDRIKNA